MKMLERGKMERGVYEIVDTESLVPTEHLLRKIDAAINWNKLYDMVEPLYCEDNGRPSIDPVVLFKMALIQHRLPWRLCHGRWSACGRRNQGKACGSPHQGPVRC